MYILILANLFSKWCGGTVVWCFWQNLCPNEENFTLQLGSKKTSKNYVFCLVVSGIYRTFALFFEDREK